MKAKADGRRGWLGSAYIWAALTPLIFYLARRFPLERTRWRQSLLHAEYVVTLQDGTQLNSGRSYRQTLQSLLDDSF